MLTARRFLSLAAILLVVGFVFGLVRLLALRYSTGDVFPPYSTLRADPLGTQVFYESLRTLPDREVRRGERDLDQLLGQGEGTTLLVLGVRTAMLSDKERAALERFVQTGGRLAVTFLPRYTAREKRSASAAPTGTPSSSASPSAETEPTPRGISLEKLFHDVRVNVDRADEDDVARRREELPIEEELSWHSGITFEPRDDAWRVLYETQRGPVVIERSVGAGSVVLAGDSYFVSNEALLTERAPALLAWLIGPAREVIFDETHLNIREQPGIMTLLRRYGLTGFVLGLVLFVALWAWQNSASALAPRRVRSSDEIVSGRDSFAGFVQLLRRGIAPQQLLETCVAEWKKSAPVAGAKPPDAAAVITAAREANEDPVATYNRISELLNSRKWKTSSSN